MTDYCDASSPVLAWQVDVEVKRGGVNDDAEEIARRTALAVAAIKQAMGNSSVALFVTHHLHEIEASYWQSHAGTPRPSPKQILDLLQLRSHWGQDGKGGVGTFDFTLPGEVTDYVITVKFGKHGDIQAIDMES